MKMYQCEMKYEYIDDNELELMFEEAIDDYEPEVTICNTCYLASRILRECNPVEYEYLYLD